MVEIKTFIRFFEYIAIGQHLAVLLRKILQAAGKGHGLSHDRHPAFILFIQTGYDDFCGDNACFKTDSFREFSFFQKELHPLAEFLASLQGRHCCWGA